MRGLRLPKNTRLTSGTLASQWSEGRAVATTDLFDVESFHLKDQILHRPPSDFRRGVLLKVTENCRWVESEQREAPEIQKKKKKKRKVRKETQPNYLGLNLDSTTLLGKVFTHFLPHFPYLWDGLTQQLPRQDWGRYLFIYLKYYLFIWLRHATCGMVVPWLGIEPAAPTLGLWCLTTEHQGSPWWKYFRCHTQSA